MKLSNYVVLGALVALFAMPLTASAQGGGGGGQRGAGGRGGFGQRGGMMMGGQSNLQLVNRADVQKDLKITADQKTALDKLQADQQAAMQKRMEDMRNGGGGGFDRNAMMAEFEKIQKEQNDAIDKILTDDQKTRLKQISLQMRGARALTDKDIQKELGLDKDQVRKIEDLQTSQQSANQEVFQKVQSGEIDRSEIQSIMEKNNKILDEALLKVLTSDQSAKFKTMQGPEFKRDPKVDEAMQQRRGGFGGRGGGGGGGGL